MLNLDRCDELIDQALASHTREDFQRAVAPLLSEYEILSVGVGRAATHWRARVIDSERFDLVDQMDYPPPHCITKPGRLNDVGEPYFYLASTAETAIAEVEAREGQLVQVAGFRIVPNGVLRLICLGEYQHVYKRGYTSFNGTDPDGTIGKLVQNMPIEIREVRLCIDSFLAQVISDKEARSKGYLHSRALRDMLFSKVGADAITYPSTRDAGGVNTAVKADSSDELYINVCCMIVRVGKKRRFAPLQMNLVGVATGLTPDRKSFAWSEESEPTEIVMYNMTKEEFESRS